jgi:thioesterase III
LARRPPFGTLSAMLGKPHRYSLEILERHLDTFGHVNNAVYLEILEEARWDWITRNGYGMRDVHELKQGPTILECSLRFLKELLLRETIQVESFVESMKGKTGQVIQKIWKQDGTLACEARFTVALFDLRARRLIAPTPRWLTAMGLSAEQPIDA